MMKLKEMYCCERKIIFYYIYIMMIRYIITMRNFNIFAELKWQFFHSCFLVFVLISLHVFSILCTIFHPSSMNSVPNLYIFLLILGYLRLWLCFTIWDMLFVLFPENNGYDEPCENKKIFTLFCNRTRK